MAKKKKNQFDWKEAEKKWLAFWEKEKVYKFDPEAKGEIYSIDTPPPTVSGKMHMGHAFMYSQMDFIARFRRMAGFNLFYPFGTDDNGLPTKLLIEKEKNVKAAEMDRKDFVKLCLTTLEKEIRPKYLEDWKKLGISCDFDLFYTTINPHCQKISQKSFIDLYKKGREYRKEAPAIWCPKCQTAISQVECEDKEIKSSFNDIVFKVDGKDLVIATTRPELLPACVAVFFHPDDKRYQKLEGKKAKVPLFDMEVPILPDERADPEKGTGIVMCCTFGDQTDMEWQKAHKLPIITAISRQGKMTDAAGKYEGMSIREARKQIIADLKEANLLVNQKPLKHDVNVHERCGTEIEFIHSKQWFIKYLDLKKRMLDWGRKLKWYPGHMRNRYENWAKGLQWDWCISRQIEFGIPFPVWYCSKCDEPILAEEKDLPVDPVADKPPLKECPKCRNTEFVPEKDIINTWATSSLTPQIAAELVPEIYDRIYPMTMRPQGHDIITFWLFNTVVKSQLHNKTNPWQDCMITGWALDPKGKKMSKSKGNVVEPQAVWEKYPIDALRFWAAGSRLGEDLPYQEKDIVTGQKTIVKLWNASRFAFMHLEDYAPEELHHSDLELYDRAVLSKMNEMVKEATENFEKYDYSITKMLAEQFFWSNICDYYLEIVKDRLYNPDKRGEAERRSAQYTLYKLILTTLKLFAPIMPYITEEIYQQYFRKHEEAKSIHLTKWPKYDAKFVDKELNQVLEFANNFVLAARKAKSEKNVSLKNEVKLISAKGKIGPGDFDRIRGDLTATTNAIEMHYEELPGKTEETFVLDKIEI